VLKSGSVQELCSSLSVCILDLLSGYTPEQIVHHSLIAELGPAIVRYREFVLFHSEYVRIEYLIAYHRCNGGEKLSAVVDGQSVYGKHIPSVEFGFRVCFGCALDLGCAKLLFCDETVTFAQTL
jgi:hypothetical protein